MPGLNQLKQFTAEILNLGDEVKIRAARGEKPVTVPIPRDISIDDDAEDFRFGMPTLSEEEEQQIQALEEERNRQQNDFSDITGESSESVDDNYVDPTNGPAPDMSDLLGGAGVDDEDLSEFLDNEPEQDEEEDEPEEESIADWDLDAMLSGAGTSKQADDDDDPYGLGNWESSYAPKEPKTNKFNPHKKDYEPSSEDFAADFPSGEDLFNDAATNLASDAYSDAQQSDDGDDWSLPPMEDDFPSNDLGGSVNMNEGLPPEFNESVNDADDYSIPSQSDSGLDDDMPEFPGEGEAFPDDGPALSKSISMEENFDDESNGDDNSYMDSDSGDSGIDDTSFLDGKDTPPQEPENDEPVEQYDTTGMDIDFDDPEMKGDESFGMPLGDDDFEMPVLLDDSAAKKKKPNVSTPNFSEAEEDEQNRPKNTFTDAEYRLFRKNLSEYPLNLRLAIESMVVNNEYTDDTIYDTLEKVLRKVPARQLASHLEKLDIHVDVPRDFERRTAEEYEIYKQSLEYKLKNRIIPFAIVTACAAILIFCILFLSWNFIWKPMRAEHFYKQGYAQIQENLYPQSEESFNMAVRNKAKKNWFYKYAESYSDHHQYERAKNVYKHALNLFNHDKKAGLDWAKMAQTEQFDYEESERILKREVLDYHTNDPDAVLQLGDLYLEWGDEVDKTKYEDAKIQYDSLVLSNPKNKNALYLYNSREMRYYVHVDDLQKVLQYKSMFYPGNMKGLDSRDLTELSGYLFDKRYGTLRPSEEHLRNDISDVKDLLSQAVKKDQRNPTALYNMGRYYIETDNYKNAEGVLKASIENFENKSRKSKKETRTFVDAYRLLGEQYADQREYILAQQTYSNGINLFEKENMTGAFESSGDIGKLYADLGDINYYINGDMEAALDNYQQSIENKNDNAKVRYKVGYIDYKNRDYDGAWESFVKGNEYANGDDTHTLLGLANTLAIKDDYYSAQGYYQELVDELKARFGKYDMVVPQGRSDHADLVDTYMKATNNLGVALARIAEQDGDSSANGQAFVNFSESSRAWDSLSRNQDTMERVKTRNLATQNSNYVANPTQGFEPTIYTEIPMSMDDEEGLKLN